MDKEILIKRKSEMMNTGNPYEVHTVDCILWNAKLFLINAMIHLNCDISQVVDKVIEYGKQQKQAPENPNVIEIYRKAASLLEIEFET